MKRIMFNFGVAFAAFCIGVGCELALNRYLDAVFAQPEVIDLATPILHHSCMARPLAGSLPFELQRLDEKYRRQCQLPTDWNGEWPTIRQLSRFRVCNDEWATARRNAIDAELNNYYVRY